MIQPTQTIAPKACPELEGPVQGSDCHLLNQDSLAVAALYGVIQRDADIEVMDPPALHEHFKRSIPSIKGAITKVGSDYAKNGMMIIHNQMSAAIAMTPSEKSKRGIKEVCIAICDLSLDLRDKARAAL